MSTIESGAGGSFEIDKATGERRLVTPPSEHHPEGDRARNEKGEPIDKPLDKVEPALPAPGPAPWATPAETTAAEPAKGRSFLERISPARPAAAAVPKED